MSYSIKIKNLLTGATTTKSPTYPLFNHESYKIQVSISDEGYTSSFRKAARWDFGDGTVVEGHDATHFYTTPGRYTIHCTLYRINREVVEDEVAPIEVIVREVVPTELTFINPSSWTAGNRYISKNNRLGTMQITTGINVASEPKVSAVRRRSDSNEMLSYFDINEESFYHLKRYYTFLEEQATYHFDGEYANTILKPVQEYTPEYIPLYGRYVANGSEVSLEAYAVTSKENASYANSLFRPYRTDRLDGTRVSSFTVVRKDKISEVPEGCTFIGKIATFNVWYKNDIAENDNDLLFEIKKDSLKFISEPLTSESYLNIPPLGISVTTINNIPENQRVLALTCNGLYSGDYEGIVEKFLAHNFYKNHTVQAYYSYFVKNDDLDGKQSLNIIKYLSTRPAPLAEKAYFEGSDCAIIEKETGGFYRLYDITPFESGFEIADQSGTIYTHGNLVDLEELVLPSEKKDDQDISRLLDVYMQHPMYDSSTNLKTFLQDIFQSKNILSYLTTKSTNFMNDNVDYKTCYVDKLLSILDMLDAPTTRYDITSFEKVNDLRELTRILTMNYSHLFGNVLTNEYDISVTPSSTAKNVGERIEPDSVIFCDSEYNVIGYRRGSNIYQLSDPSPYIIVKDDLTYKTHLASFHGVEDYEYEEFVDQSEEWKAKNSAFIARVAHSYKFSDYDHRWGWTLNLPEETRGWNNKHDLIDSCYTFYFFNPVKEKIRKYNFLDENIIPESEENPGEQMTVEEWSRDFGFVHDCLMKVLNQNLK